MADAVVSTLLDQLASIVREQVEQEVKLVMGVDNEVAKLRSNLQSIEVVLEDAEKKQLKENNVRRWLDELKDISFDMDDVFDEWSTAIFKSKIEKSEKGADQENDDDDDHPHPHGHLVSRKKVFFSVLFPCFPFGHISQVGHRLDIAFKIKDLNGKLEDIALRKDMYNFSITRTIDETERPKTTSIVDVSEVRGRDKVKDDLVNKLLRGSSQEERSLHIIPIVGMGGIGKTTLAQLAFNDDKIKIHFDIRLWVSVSDPFDVTKIAKAIIEQFTGQASPLLEMEALMQRLLESIRDKKFFLVLDDVWTDNYQRWEQLRQILRYGTVESRILVTTRKEEVAIMMGAEDRIIQLQELSEENCWLVFSQLSFFGRDEEEKERLEEIGRKISRKCKGLPLAAKTLGSLMRFKKTKEQWLDILHSEIWDLEEAKKNLFPPLLLSYYDLSPVEKRCFSYCAIFHKDDLIQRDELIQQWMSQGYFTLKKYVRKETRGKECFEHLAMRSFFQDFKKDDDGNIVACKMHDIVHDFAQFLTRNEYSAIDFCGKDDEERQDLVGEETRHLNLANLPSDPRFLTSILKRKNVRTLVISNWSGGFSAYILNLSRLRTLNLSWCSIHTVPRDVGKLIHMRYLDLSYNDISNLPTSIGNLFNLQTLRLIGCESLLEIPETIGNLVNLRHLYTKGCENLLWLPKVIGKLTSLRMMDNFIISRDRDNKKGCQIDDLRNLNNLCQIYVNGLANVQGANEAKEAKLEKKKDLFHLSLEFWTITGRNNIQESVALEALKPHPNLESLEISSYGGISFPTWMISLTNLSKLVLHACHNCEFLPPLGRLPSLESLTVSDFQSVKKLGLEFLGIDENELEKSSELTLFPKLRRLYFRNMGMNQWLGSCGMTIMPRIRTLQFGFCDNLETLPDFFQSIPLKNLIIVACPRLRKGCQKGRGKEWDKISHIPNIHFANQKP
ncbi:LRR domain containing protein [Trema orientale]|uniref:LRR domain containing protein n=1 Tax=Trema orientale TaxID=63057 RepID=A0A2P5BHC5_TREOI|nr:LRR domain containing protein [Trema orientale]